ncbi:MAG TPA: peptide deformylase [Flavobacterium sp.]|jgi:peptide deformylase|nr:peptide deformylase [Flavobacterium sp.]
MAKLLKIYDYKEPILRSKCRDIEHMESWVLDLASNMWETMLRSKAVGLAANQVGFDYKMITVKAPMFEGPMINPIIEEQSEEKYHTYEQCLSIPGYSFDTGKRSRAIKVRYFDLEGKLQITWLKDETAVIVQHEIEHLAGLMMIDHMEPGMR